MSTEQNIEEAITRMGTDLRFLFNGVDPVNNSSAYDIAIDAAGKPILQKKQFVWSLGSQFLLHPNEMNGWRERGPFDDAITTDLNNIGEDPIGLSGGLVFPWDVKLLSMFAWHRNSNNAVEPWGWVIFKQQKTAGSNNTNSTFIIDEVTENNGVGTRDYGNDRIQQTNLDLTTKSDVLRTLAAGETLTLAVAAPTTNGSSFYVNIMSGYLLFERI